jgi:hypothetical protein
MFRMPNSQTAVVVGWNQNRIKPRKIEASSQKAKFTKKKKKWIFNDVV